MKLSTVNDTIAAIATPNGRGGVGIVRISGAKALAIAQVLIQQQQLQLVLLLIIQKQFFLQ